MELENGLMEEGQEGEGEGGAEDDADAAIASMMGFGGFGTTKGQHVSGNQEGGSKVNKPRTWRQYMNRCVLFLGMRHSILTDGTTFLDVEGSIDLSTRSSRTIRLVSCSFVILTVR